MQTYWEADHFDEAWETVVLPWMESCQGSFNNAIVSPNSGISRQVKERLIKSGKSSLGIDFWAPGVLRQRLTKAAGIDKLVALREDLQWVMSQVAEESEKDGVTKTIQREPELLVKACDLIERAGWPESIFEDKDLEELAALYKTRLKEYGMETVQGIENYVYNSKGNQAKVFNNLLLLGFSSHDWESYKVLKSAAKSSESAVLCFLKEKGIRSEEQCWQGSWEEDYGSATQLEAKNVGPFFKASQNFEYPDLLETYDEEDKAPKYWLAKSSQGEAQTISNLIVEALNSGEARRIGIVFASETSSLARTVGVQLVRNGIPHYDSIGHAGDLSAKESIFSIWCNWQNDPRVDPFISWVEALRDQGLVEYQAAEKLRVTLKKAFQELGTGDMRVIRSFIEINSPDSPALKWLQKWEHLPARDSFEALAAKAHTILQEISWNEGIEILQKRLLGLGKGAQEETTKELFLKWLSEVMRQLGRIKPSLGNEPYAQVHLTTMREAIGQSWTDLIIAGLNDGEWGENSQELTFLKDDIIEKYNSKAIQQGPQGEGHCVLAKGKSLMPSARMRSRQMEASFAKLISLPNNSLNLSAHSKEYATEGNSIGLNPFLERLYWVSEGTLLDEAEKHKLEAKTEFWLNAEGKGSIENTKLEETDPMLNAHEARRDKTAPFSEYQFCFKTPPKEGLSLSCKDWDRLLQNPGSGWIQYILKIKRHSEIENNRIQSLTNGTWMHDWVSLKGQGSLPRPKGDEWPDKIENQSNRLKSKVAKAYETAGRSLPEWWSGNWAQSRQLAKQLVGEILINDAFTQLLSEEPLKTDTHAEIEGACKIPTKGRTDLIGVEGKTAAWIVDFKTGSQGGLSIKKIMKGEGLQLALYTLAYKSLGYENVWASVLNPGDSLRKQISLEKLEEIKDFWQSLDRIQKTGILGQYGPIRSSHSNTGDYPLATLAIDETILSEKWKLTHPEIPRD